MPNQSGYFLPQLRGLRGAQPIANPTQPRGAQPFQAPKAPTFASPTGTGQGAGTGVLPPNGGTRTGAGPGWTGQGGQQTDLHPDWPKTGPGGVNYGTAGNHGALWYPIVPAGTTDKRAFNPIQFPTWNDVGNGYSVDEYGRTAYMPDYAKSANMTFATQESNALWSRLPPADRIYLYSWSGDVGASSRNAWVQAMAEGRVQDADKIKRDYESWKQGQARAEQQQQYQNSQYKAPTNPAPYFAP